MRPLRFSGFVVLLIPLLILLFLLVLISSDLSSTVSGQSSSPAYQWGINKEIDLSEWSEHPTEVSYSHQGKYLAFTTDRLVVIDATDGSKVLEWSPSEPLNSGCIAWSRDDSMVAFADGVSVKVIDTGTGKLIKDLQTGSFFETLEFNHDDTFLGLSTGNGVKVYRTSSWTLEERIVIMNRTILDFTWSPVQERMFVFTDFGIYRYNTTSWENLEDFKNDSVGRGGTWVDDHIYVYPTEFDSIFELNMTSDIDRLITRVSISLDSAQVLYDHASDDVILHGSDFPKVFDRTTGALVQPLRHLFSEPRDSIDASISSDGLELAVLWTSADNKHHLSLLEKQDVPSPSKGPDNPQVVFAMLSAYGFRYDFPSMLTPYEITSIELLFGEYGGVTWRDGADPIVTCQHVVCSDIIFSDAADRYVIFQFYFNWTFPENKSIPITLSVTTSDDIRFEWTYPDALTMVTALEFLGDPTVVGSIQGVLGNNSWVQANETIEWTLPRIVYSGYPEAPSPPSSEVMLRLQRATLIEWSGPPTENDTTTVTLKAPDVQFASYRYLVVGRLVGNSEGFDTYQLDLLVDGRPPSFLGYLPEPGIWQATSDVVVAVWVSDDEGSGLDETSLHLSWRSGQGGPWSEWSDISMTDMGDGSTFGWMELELQEGRVNEIRWRCSDNVGNTNGTGPMEVLVDLHHVTFHDFMPDRWINSTDASCSINISDVGGSGVSGPSIQVRWSTNGISWYGEWVSLGLTGTDELLNVLKSIVLVAGTDNYVQWRAEDVAGTGLTDSRHYSVWIDTTPPVLGAFLPTIIQQAHEFVVSIEVSDSGGSGLDIADVDWRLDGQDWQNVDVLSDGTASATVMVAMDGQHSVTFRAWDGAMNPTVSSVFVVTVDTSPPEFAWIHPPSGRYVIGTSCNVTVDVVDAFAGVDESSLVYSVRRGPTSDWGSWLQVPSLTGSSDNITGSVHLDLDPDHDNWIRFRVFDLVGNGPAETEAIHLPVDMPPIARISSPIVDEIYFDDVRVYFDSSGSNDIEGSIRVEWYIDGELMKETSLDFHKKLPAGNHTISLVVIDEAGQSNETEVTILVQTAEVKTWSSPWLLLVTILIAIIASALLLYRRRVLTEE